MDGGGSCKGRMIRKRSKRKMKKPDNQRETQAEGGWGEAIL